MSSYFVTSTGTEIGKTYVTAGILRAHRAAGRAANAVKPVVSGFTAETARGSDPAVLLAAMGAPVTPENIAAISPWRYAAPISPDMAAAREGREIDFEGLIGFSQAAMASAPGLFLIEGVGGAGVPLTRTQLVADWILELRIPALLVAGSYLGTISHTITTAEALAARDIPIAAIVLNESESSPVALTETADTLRHFLPHPVHIVHRQAYGQSFRGLAALLAQ